MEEEDEQGVADQGGQEEQGNSTSYLMRLPKIANHNNYYMRLWVLL